MKGMLPLEESNDVKKDEKWDFEDYAFTITGVIVGLLLIGPDILYGFFGISILGGSLSDLGDEIAENVEHGGSIVRNFNQFRVFAPFLFLLTTTICFFKDAFDTRKKGSYTGSVFTHTFESLFEDAIYMTITTTMVYTGLITGRMYSSWLAGPITWVLFIFIFPFVKKRRGIDVEDDDTPWLLLVILLIGIVAEAITGAWVAFPLSWLVICIIKLVDVVRDDKYTTDTIFNIMYYAFSVVLLAMGIILDFWMTSWIAFPIALLICWILSKFKRFKKVKTD